MKIQKATKKIVILYDGGCSDGFGVAWAGGKICGGKADYIGVRHETPPPAGLKNKTIYLIDFTYPKAIIKKFLKENKRVTAIDHHITAETAVKLTQNHLFSVSHSGAALAWQYFHPKKPLPALLRHIEDIDLWRFKVPHTKEVFAYLQLFELNFKIWDKLVRDYENPKRKKEFIEKGALLLKYENKSIADLVSRNAELVKFSGIKTLAVNSPNWPSQIGNLLCQKLPPMGIIWSKKGNKISVSLRSNGAVHVGKIAQRFGGGGHKASAGFTLPGNAKLPWKTIPHS